MSNLMTYARQSLAACGFVVLDSTVAATLRPDLWSDGMQSAGDFAQQYTKSQLASIGGVQAWNVKLDGLDRTVQVLARTADDLPKRIRWITGRRVDRLWQNDDAPQVAKPMPTIPRRPDQATGDRYAGQVTAEPGRTCSSCEAFTAGYTCSHVGSSGIERPAPNAPRRCLGYKPMAETMDDRGGWALWPELITIKQVPARVAALN